MSNQKHIIISLGGSLIVPDDIDSVFIKAFISLISDYVKNGFRFVIITGGGRVCRRYQDALKKISTPSNNTLDWLGIYSTRLNAEFLRIAFGEIAHDEIIIDPNFVPNTEKPIIIGAGWKPGWSTDYVAVLIAKQVNALSVVNLSNIDYAYTKDPRKFSDAVPIKSTTWKEFRTLLPKEWDPGLNAPFDPIAAEEAESIGLQVAIMNGANISNLKNYFDDSDFVGTVVN